MIDRIGFPAGKDHAEGSENVPPATSGTDESGFRPECHEEFIGLLGTAQAAKWMEHLDNQLASAFVDDEQEAGALRKTAHAMVPLAGTPGFLDLARCCADLDHAILSGNCYFQELAAVRREVKRAAIALSRLRSDLTKRTQPDQT